MNVSAAVDDVRCAQRDCDVLGLQTQLQPLGRRHRLIAQRRGDVERRDKVARKVALLRCALSCKAIGDAGVRRRWRRGERQARRARRAVARDELAVGAIQWEFGLTDQRNEFDGAIVGARHGLVQRCLQELPCDAARREEARHAAVVRITKHFATRLTQARRLAIHNRLSLFCSRRTACVRHRTHELQKSATTVGVAVTELLRCCHATQHLVEPLRQFGRRPVQRFAVDLNVATETRCLIRRRRLFANAYRIR